MQDLDIDIRIRLGDFDLVVAHAFSGTGTTSLFGPSGSGKSTLLRIIAGLECGAHGQVRVGDENRQSEAPRLLVPAHRRDVALGLQEARLLPHLNVAGN
ncbi:MAG: ATP-binding cassette domain-containing protein, partial [Pseudomonadota bacterium]|nr:ATP-binding cassette domain-containing protein [Pseudomonadota bacterium]